MKSICRYSKGPIEKTSKMKFRKLLKCSIKNIYSRVPGGDETQIDTYLNSLELPTLNEEQNKRMITDITEEEIKIAISRLKLGKSPGSDGYTAEWYKEFKNELIPVILLLWHSTEAVAFFSLPVLALIFPACSLVSSHLLRDSLCTALETERLWI